MPAASVHPSLPERQPRASPNPIMDPEQEKTSRIAILAFAIPLGLFAIVLAAAVIISVVGHAKWNRTKADLLARGEKLSLRDFEPPPVPDTENFYADEVWWEITDRAGNPGLLAPSGRRQIDVLETPLSKESIESLRRLVPDFRDRTSCTLKAAVTAAAAALEKSSDVEARKRLARFILTEIEPANPLLERINGLLDRPLARTPLVYDQALLVSTDHLAPILNISQALRARTAAAIAEENASSAAADIRDQFRLAATLSGEPLLLTALVRMSILAFAAECVRVGMNGWEDADLETFESQIAQIDLLSDLQTTVRAERGGLNDTVDALSNKRMTLSDLYGGKPTPPLLSFGFVIYTAISMEADRAKSNLQMQQWIDALSAPREHGLTPSAFALPRKSTGLDWFHQRLFTEMVVPNIETATSKAAHIQSQLDLLRIACALERFRRAGGAYPSTLEELVPAFLPTIPSDIMTGAPMRYIRDTPDDFRLWSVGWDRIDDGGVAPTSRGSTAKGDWIWESPPAAR